MTKFLRHQKKKMAKMFTSALVTVTQVIYVYPAILARLFMNVYVANVTHVILLLAVISHAKCYHISYPQAFFPLP